MNIVEAINLGIFVVITWAYFILGIILDILTKTFALIISVLVGIYAALISPFKKSMYKKQWINDLEEIGGNWRWKENNWYFVHFFCEELFF